MVRLHSMVFGVTCCLSGLGGTAAVRGANEGFLARPDAIEGKWLETATVTRGPELSTEVGAVWEFRADNKYLMYFRDGRATEGRYQLDSATNPWSIDLVAGQSQDSGPQRGIAVVDGEYLKICVNDTAEGTRPTTFANEGTRCTLRVMKRLDGLTQNGTVVRSLVNPDFEVPPDVKKKSPTGDFLKDQGS